MCGRRKPTDRARRRVVVRDDTASSGADGARL